MKFNQNLLKIKNVIFHRHFTYILAKFMLFVTAFVTDVFLYITNIFWFNHNYLTATETAETTEYNWCIMWMKRK